MPLARLIVMPSGESVLPMSKKSPLTAASALFHAPNWLTVLRLVT